MYETYDDNLDNEPDGAVVHWMDRPRHHLSTTGLSSVVAGAFLIGAGVGLAIAVLTERLAVGESLRHRAGRLLH